MHKRFQANRAIHFILKEYSPKIIENRHKINMASIARIQQMLLIIFL